MVDVVLAEDVDVQRSLLRRLVEQEHTIVGTTSTAAGVVRLVKHRDPDVVLMDINLENSDGITATASIRTFDESVVIIISTAHVDDEKIDDAVESGADEYLIKPYDAETLLGTIDGLI
jgi:Response regulator containing CheY-like receiver, AAA-type ATPase, and DNA-binding domains